MKVRELMTYWSARISTLLCSFLVCTPMPVILSWSTTCFSTSDIGFGLAQPRQPTPDISVLR